MGLNLSGMTTETRNPRTMQLDQMSPLEIVTVMNEEDARVPLAIAKCLPQIAQAVTWAACTNPYQSFLIRYAREVEFLFGEVPPLFMYTLHPCCPP